MSQSKKEYFVPCIKNPDVFEIAKWLEAYKDVKAKENEADPTIDPEGDIWLLSMHIQMNRSTIKDDNIPAPWKHQLTIEVKVPLPFTPFINPQTLDFKTPLTPQWSWTIDQFQGQMGPGGVLDQCLANFQPHNVLYINHVRLLHRGPIGNNPQAFSIAQFGKTQKVRC